MVRENEHAEDRDGDSPPPDDGGLTPALQEVVMTIARSMEVQDVHRFQELADGMILYVARTPDGAGFTAATIAGEAAQLEFLTRLAQDRPRRNMAPPYSGAEVAELEARLGAELPPLIRFYLTNVSSGWRPRPFSAGQDSVIDIGPLGAVRVRSSALLRDAGGKAKSNSGSGDDDDEKDRIGDTSTLLELSPLSGKCGAAVVIAGLGRGLAVTTRGDLESAEGGARTVPLWSVLFEAFF